MLYSLLNTPFLALFLRLFFLCFFFNFRSFKSKALKNLNMEITLNTLIGIFITSFPRNVHVPDSGVPACPVNCA